MFIYQYFYSVTPQTSNIPTSCPSTPMPELIRALALSSFLYGRQADDLLSVFPYEKAGHITSHSVGANQWISEKLEK